MTQNLNHYEKILSRSHSNYLAQISIEMTEANNQINDVLSKLTALGTVLIPMNLVTGLWGMNVHVPGQEVEVREVVAGTIFIADIFTPLTGICLVLLNHWCPCRICCRSRVFDIQIDGATMRSTRGVILYVSLGIMFIFRITNNEGNILGID